jgi:putative glutamine amidotransferase
VSDLFRVPGAEAPVVALSASHFPPDDTRPLFKGKRLWYSEQNMAEWLLNAGLLPWLVPMAAPERAPAIAKSWLSRCDGLVLSGGTDVDPIVYGQAARRPEWRGDRYRDLYELALIHEALERELPILGVCRGAQILNVALGGSLRQDIADEVPNALDHRNWELYEHNGHEVRFGEDRWLESLYGRASGWVNSIHHQAVLDLAPGCTILARATDGVVEAFRDPRRGFCVGVQWHPEFIANTDDGNGRALSARPIADAFRRACVAYRAGTAIRSAERSVRSER